MFTDLGLYLVGSLIIDKAATARDLFLERWIFKSRSSNCLGMDLDSMTELCRLSLQEIAAPPPLAVLISEFLVAFLSQE